MTETDPDRERTSAVRRSRVARQGLVAGAVAGSLGIAGALGLSAAVGQGATSAASTTGAPSTSGTDQDGAQSRGYVVQGDDGGELDDGGGQVWVPTPPTGQFGGGAGGGVPHAQSAGS